MGFLEIREGTKEAYNVNLNVTLFIYLYNIMSLKAVLSLVYSELGICNYDLQIHSLSLSVIP